MLIINLLIFIFSLVTLVYASSLGVKSLVKVAQALRISEFVMAFIIGAIATSLPELFVSIKASLIKEGNIVIGNIVGSNIADVALVAGLVIVFARNISTKNKKIRRDAIWMFILGSLPLLLFFLGNGLSRIDGIILIATSFFYIHYIFKIKAQFKEKLKDRIKAKELFLYTVLLIASFTIVYFSSGIVVKYAKLLAMDLKISTLFVSLFLISIGTSLPELSLEIQAIRLHQSPVALGDLLGSVITNSTVILGLSAIINPIVTEPLPIFIAGLFFILAAYLFVTFMHVSKKLTTAEGVGLILLYILFIMVSLYMRILPKT